MVLPDIIYEKKKKKWASSSKVAIMVQVKFCCGIYLIYCQYYRIENPYWRELKDS